MLEGLTQWFFLNDFIQITPKILLLVFCAGLVGGIVDTIVGGGGLIVLPVLLAIGLPPHLALGTSKMQATFGTSMATLQFHRKGLVNIKVLFPFAFLLTFVSAICGVFVLKATSTAYIGKIMPILMSVILVYRVIFFSHGNYDSHKPYLKITSFIVIFSSLLGFYDGFFGPGVGTLWTFAFVTFLGMNSLSATANAKFVNFASNVGSLCVMIPLGLICYQIAIVMGVAQLLGAKIGVHFAVKNGAKFINIAFIFILTIIIINLFIKYY